MRSVIFRGLADDYSRKKAENDRERQLPPVREAEEVENREYHHGNEAGAEVCSAAEGTEKFLKACTFLGPDGINADD